MRIYNKLTHKKTYRAIAIGNFDGVHIGHKKILSELCIEAKKRKLMSSVMTFYPHPKYYIHSKNNTVSNSNYSYTICNLRDRIIRILHCNIEEIIIQRFNKSFSKITALDFIENILVKNLKVKFILIGRDFRFGYSRLGDIDLLKDVCQKYSIEVFVVQDVKYNDKNRISSSIIRDALQYGNLQESKMLLGNNVSISGHIVHGNKIGRKLGFPTININVPQNIALKQGVYCVYVHGIYRSPIYGVANLGIRRTLGDNGRILLEVHLLNISVNVYGKVVMVEFVHRLRDEKKFPNMKDMTLAISYDVKNALNYFANYGL